MTDPRKIMVIVDPSRTHKDKACFWRPDSRGYTFDIASAGRYTPEESEEITANCDDFAMTEREAEALAVRTVDFWDIPLSYREPKSGDKP